MLTREQNSRRIVFPQIASSHMGLWIWLLGALLVILVLPGFSMAEVLDFGGHPERFKGKGDREPPHCQVNLPNATVSPFFVKWNCSDNFALTDNIRTELWIYRKDAPAAELLANFLGFPASVFVDEGVLGVENFTDGLPVGFRLYARDRAGIGAATPLLTVVARDNSLSNCSLSVVTEATISSGGTTGVPSMEVTAIDVEVNSSEISQDVVEISTPGEVDTDSCEIDSICQNNDRITFESTLSLDETDAATGTVSIIPGSIVVSVEGQANVSNAVLTRVSVSGNTTIDGTPATVSLVCAH